MLMVTRGRRGEGGLATREMGRNVQRAREPICSTTSPTRTSYREAIKSKNLPHEEFRQRVLLYCT